MERTLSPTGLLLTGYSAADREGAAGLRRASQPIELNYELVSEGGFPHLPCTPYLSQQASRRDVCKEQRRRAVTAHSPDFNPDDRGGTGSRRANLRRRLVAGLAILALVSWAAVYAAQSSRRGGRHPPYWLHAAIPSLADLVEKVRPAVVSIRVRAALTTTSTSGDGIPLEGSPFEKLFRDPPTGPKPKRLVDAQGSGFLVSADGFIVTNNHLVDGGTVQVQAMMANGKVADARVVGRDPVTDIALLKIDEGSHLPFVTLADTKPRVGDGVIAIGNPFGLGSTVTAGIVSAMDRDIGVYPLWQRLHPDRRTHQPRQFWRADVRHARPGDRH